MTVGVVLVFVVGWILVSPATAGNAVKASYHALPGPVKGLVPDPMEQSLGRGVDAVTRFFMFGNAHRLIDLGVRLEYASWAPGTWGATHQLELRWTDVAAGVSYDVRAGHGSNAGDGLDVPLGTVEEPRATVELPADGDWYVRIRPLVGSDAGRTSTFGPFRVDSTPPPAPRLDAILPPPGYSFGLSWSPVSDASGVVSYQVEQRPSGAALFQPVAQTEGLAHREDQVGNGAYEYRLRAINGAGLLSGPSNAEAVTVRAPMSNPGPGSFAYGIHANYTSFMKLWDLSDPARYAQVGDVPRDIADAYLGGGYGFETANATLRARTQQIVGGEKNTLKIAEALFVWLFDYADYDQCKLDPSLPGCPPAGPDGQALQRAGETYDRRRGICGDLATLYITMLRIAGVPARPVHGYLDNPGAGIGDFHVWVEVWVGASLRSGDQSDTREDWMTVDVSGITGPYSPEDLMVYFGIFNPEYLALGLEADYAHEGWNAWAQFGWRSAGGVQPEFEASGRPPVETAYETRHLYFNLETKERLLVRGTGQNSCDGEVPPGFLACFPSIKTVSVKRIDYGVNVSGPKPIDATIRLRHPVADAFAAVLPWQSVIYTIYTQSDTVQKLPGKPYTHLDPLGFVVWEDDYG